MNIEEARNYCIHKKGVSECLPFDENTLVFKLMDKMFALIPTEKEAQISLKCQPEKAIELRERFAFIEAAYHMNKQHWITLFLSQTHDDLLVKELIDNSYQLVMSKLPKKTRMILEEM